MASPKIKECRLYEAVQTDGRVTYHPDAKDWNGSLERFGELPPAKRVLKDVIFEPVKQGANHQLTLHKPIQKNFMSVIGDDNKVTDMLTDEEKRARFAYSSTVMFTDHTTIFGIVKGDRSSPSHVDVRNFLESYYECPTGFKWEVRPLPSPSDVNRMKEADGINLFTTKFSTFRDLFSSDLEKEHLSDYANKLADKFGTDLEVFVEVRLPRSTRSMGPARKMKSYFSKDLGTTVGRGRGSKARIVSQNGDEELIELLEHHLAIQFDIPGSGTEKARFSHLTDGLESIRGEINNKVGELLKEG